GRAAGPGGLGGRWRLARPAPWLCRAPGALQSRSRLGQEGSRMKRTTRLLATAGLVVAAGVALALLRSRPAPANAARLSAEDQASWTRVVAALQQVADEYHDALELEDPEAARRR